MGRLAASASVAFAAVAGKAIQMAGGYDLAMRSVQAKTRGLWRTHGPALGAISERWAGRLCIRRPRQRAGRRSWRKLDLTRHEVLEALASDARPRNRRRARTWLSAADIASNVLSQDSDIETDQTARVADVLAEGGSIQRNTNVSQLGAALAKAAPSAAAAGWSLEETAAAIGKLSDAGIQGEEAGTALKTMMAKLAIDGWPS